MLYWRYSVDNPEEFNQALLRDIERANEINSECDINYKQAVSKYDGYNHELSYNANFPEFQCNYRSYSTAHKLLWKSDNQPKHDYVYYDPPGMSYRPDQQYKITLWTQLADLFHEHARAVAVPDQSMINYKINVKSMWYHQMVQGDYDNWHNHPGVQWISIYYIEVDPTEGTEYMLPNGDSFVPHVKPGDLIVAPSYQLHRSLPKVNPGTKSMIAINWEIGSKYTTEIIDHLSQTHPDNHEARDPETRPFMPGRMPPPDHYN